MVAEKTAKNFRGLLFAAPCRLNPVYSGHELCSPRVVQVSGSRFLPHQELLFCFSFSQSSKLEQSN